VNRGNVAMNRPPLIEAEVLPPVRPEVPPQGSATGGEGRGAAVPESFHPAAAALLVLVDNFWMMPEFAVATWWLTIPLCFFSVFVITFLVQRRLGKNRLPVALAKAFFFGCVAAVPFSVTGTPVGLALLAWAGVRRLTR